MLEMTGEGMQCQLLFSGQVATEYQLLESQVGTALLHLGPKDIWLTALRTEYWTSYVLRCRSIQFHIQHQLLERTSGWWLQRYM